MAIIGMDVAEVHALASQLNTSANDITTIVHNLTSKLASTTWVGNDRNKFESDWQSQHVANLNRVVAALHDAATLANQNAQQQETASNS